MEYSKSGWDLLLWPRTWHNRLNSAIPTIIPGIIIVGLIDVLAASESILSDYLLGAESNIAVRVFLFIVVSHIIGFLDVFCFAWPIADLCRYLAKRSQKFISPGFNIVFMKSYAYSHLIFMPGLLLKYSSSLQEAGVNPGAPFIAQLVFRLLVLMLSTQILWQIAIMLRTISVKSKIELPGRLIAGLAIYLWSSLEGTAIYYLIRVAYRMFDALEKII